MDSSRGNEDGAYRKKDGSISKMRSHKGNMPILPQTKLCPHCPAKFTRATHLNRHLRTHTNERIHRCETCEAQFTRSDLLTRHKKSCNDPSGRARKRSCLACMASKIKCDRETPCSKCVVRGKECTFTRLGKRTLLFDQYQRALHNRESSEETIGTTNTSTGSTSPARGTASGWDPPSADEDGPLVEVYYPESSDSSNCDSLVPVNSHLSPIFSNENDDYVQLFNKVLPVVPHNPSNPEELAFAVSDLDLEVSSEPFTLPTQNVNNAADSYEITLPNLLPHRASSHLSIWPALNDARRLFPSDLSIYGSDPAGELQHYLFLFFSIFTLQVPIVHNATFNSSQKPAFLLRAMQACGALFAKTRKANFFVTKTLESARDVLAQECAKEFVAPSDRMHLIIAVVLLQTIGLFHQQTDQRMSSAVYHSALVMMIRRTGMINANARWKPGIIAGAPLETMWLDWVDHEMTKRAILWSYMHDCCHCIYFALQPSYDPREMAVNLPCDTALWQASSPARWYATLQAKSSYPDMETRLNGENLSYTLEYMAQHHQPPTYIPLNPFAHFVIIHVILRRLFVVCSADRLRKADMTGQVDLYMGQEILALEYSLHNWIDNWKHSPEPPTVDADGDEPPFIENVLPFYWLGQVALLAYQEGYPPFEHDSSKGLQLETRFRLVKQWLKHIRCFLKNSSEAVTLFWVELMKMRLQSWQQAAEEGSLDDGEGILGWFPDQ